jgi:hypothetical protein
MGLVFDGRVDALPQRVAFGGALVGALGVVVLEQLVALVAVEVLHGL